MTLLGAFAHDHSDADPQLARQIRAEQVRLLFAHSPLPIWLATLFAVGMGIVLQDDLGAAKVWTWVVLKVAAAVPRLIQVRLYARAADRHDPIWYRSFLALLLVDGAAWGMAGSWLLPYQQPDAASLVTSCMLGGAAMATFVLQADMKANALFVLPMLVPTALTALRRPDLYSVFGGAGVLCFAAILLMEGRRSEQALVELLWLRFTTDRVAQERAQALVQAERHSAVKSQFLATMSHELRTPLHGMLGLTRLVHAHESDPALKHHLELAERSGEHLLNVINDVLDFSKIDAGHVRVESQPFDLAGLIQELAELWRVPAADKGIELRVQVEPGAHRVLGDAARVRQVLHNLLGNAIKFTEQGHVALRVRRDAASGQVVMAVEDSGIGIASADLPRVFEAFHQVDNRLGRRYTGTGLGLTISREISRAMGGDLTCTSAPGRGSTFTLSVPLPPVQDAPSSALAPIAEAPPQGHTTASPALQGRVLLAEDNPVNALLAEAILQRLGLEVQVVTDGRAAVEAVKHGSPDVVLMDCQMPVMDGFEATRQIRVEQARARGRRVPIIALTASALEGDRDRCLAAGMDGHLSKPFRDHQLVALLTPYLAFAQGPAA
ncbi:ATP-binding protein [Aquabacterium sp.]|uniref:ATP-binding protein n=1 Tax=Aquabacterium sp. TaxID=1872578 RepID=UPI0035AF84F8